MALRELDAAADSVDQGGERGQHWFEVVAATVLGVAAFASAWSAYQSGLGNSLQTFHLAKASSVGRQAAEKTVFANQVRTVDALLSVEYVRSLGN